MSCMSICLLIDHLEKIKIKNVEHDKNIKHIYRDIHNMYNLFMHITKIPLG